MANVSPKPHPPGQLFANLKIWVSHHIPERAALLRKIRIHEGTLAVLEKRADWCLISPRQPNPPAGPNYISYEWVSYSLDANELQDPRAYKVVSTSEVDRPVGSRSKSGKHTRTPFTKKDDQILWNWIVPFRDKGGRWKGNAIYQQLASEYPHHTFQSWRSRFIDYVDHLSLTVTEHIDPFEMDEDVPAAPERSSKRRRLNETTKITVNVPIIAPKQPPAVTTRDPAEVLSLPRPSTTMSSAIIIAPDSAVTRQVEPIASQKGDHVTGLVAQTTISSSDGHASDVDAIEIVQRHHPRQTLRRTSLFRSAAANFNFERVEANRLYIAVPEVCNTSPEQLESSWVKMAEEWDRHSAEEWQSFYEQAIVPEYMRRNGLTNKKELELFVLDVLAKEAENPAFTPDIKEEPVPDDRAPEVRQREAELHRARAETEDIAMSDASDEEDVEQNRRTVLREASVEIPTAALRQFSTITDESLMSQPTAVHPDEGQKKSTQRTSTTESVPQPPARPQLPPALDYTRIPRFSSASQPPTHPQAPLTSTKKKLFRTFSSTQTSNEIEGSSGVRSTAADFLPPNNALSISTSSTNQSAVSASPFSLPGTQKPPESFQQPPKSLSTSQESAKYNAAKQDMGQETIPVETVITSHKQQDNAQRDVLLPRALSPSVDLLSDEASDNDDTRSHGTLSDTGSELMAFETAPERSQMWETASHKETDAVEIDVNDKPENERTNSSSIAQTWEADQQKAIATQKQNLERRKPTPVPRRPASEEASSGGMKEDFEVDPEAHSVYYKNYTTHESAARRTETQALFQQIQVLDNDESTLFDIPPPEGGWKELDLDEEEEDPDLPINTVELPDDHPLKHRVSPAPTDITSSSPEPDSIDNGRAMIPQTTEADVQEISSDSDGETATTTSSDSGENRHAHRPIPPPLKQRPSHGIARTSFRHTSASSDEARSTASNRTSTTTSEDDLEANGRAIGSWIQTQKARYALLPNRVFRRLASTAIQSTILNIPAATLLLRHLVEAHLVAEDKRRAAFELHIPSNKNRSRTSAKQFKPLTKLSESEAKSLLPDDLMGVWTLQDDEALLSKTFHSIKRVEMKHGKAGVRKRAKFLRNRYGLDDGVGSGDGRSAGRKERRER